MIGGKFNILIDQAWGSSGKGAVSARLADIHNATDLSAANFPNAGHTTVHGDQKFIAKVLPTAAFLNRVHNRDMACWLSPGSGFDPARLLDEWDLCNKPQLYIHERASIVTPDHARREREGAESTKHLASTMQGSGAAIVDKVLRKQDVQLARDMVRYLPSDTTVAGAVDNSIDVLDASDFRDGVHKALGDPTRRWLHEGSQGYALSLDHGSHYPQCTSRNCTVQAAMDYMAVPPRLVGDVYLNLRTFPIRVGNVVEEGVQQGYSGDWYDDQEELTWEAVAAYAGMPAEERIALAERERTTVTKRVRRVATFSWKGLVDAARVNGATALCVNFVQYLDWKDHKVRGGHDALALLSPRTREFLEKAEDMTNLPVAMIGTGADHNDYVWRM